MEKITSQHNSQIKKIISLRKTSKRKKEDLIVIEGRQELELAHASGIKMESLFLCPEFQGNKVKINWSKECFVNELESEVFKKISLRETPDGFIGLAKPQLNSLSKIKLGDKALIIVLEGIEKPGNLGAILRTADAAGVDAVILSDPRTDIYNPNVIRVSLGTVFTNNVVSGTFEEVSEYLDKNNVNIVATTPDADQYYTKIDLNESVALIIGTEHEGLSEKWIDKANVKVKIPMNGKIDSLNASVSAALVVYEVIRQRND